ncbi:MAG: hypothetical protein NVSMB6_19290 [Burkholderiaceae bacterium]
MIAGARFPSISWDGIGGARIDPAVGTGWRMLVVYRGNHCPLCTVYLDQLNQMQADFGASGIQIAAVSADPKPKGKQKRWNVAGLFP